MTNSPLDADLEKDIADLLVELSGVQAELLEVLAAKRDRMAENDLEAMTQLQPREQQLCDRLEACHQRRTSLLHAAAQTGLPADSLGRLVETLPAGKRGRLAKQVKEASSRMRLLQHQSLTNWVLAQRSILHLSQMLEIIATGGRLQPTYSEGNSNTPSGALVDREA